MIACADVESCRFFDDAAIMAESIKAAFSVILSHPGIADSAKRKMRRSKVKNCIVNTAAAERKTVKNLPFGCTAFGKEIKGQRSRPISDKIDCRV